METFKNIPLYNYPIPFSRHQRGKSDLAKNKENVLVSSGNLFASIRNSVNGVNKESIVPRNPSVRSRSINLKEKVKIDVGRILVNRTGKQNFTVRNSEGEKKENIIRKNLGGRIKVTCSTERLIKKHSIPGCQTERFGKINAANQRHALQQAPNISMLSTNKFFEKLRAVQSKLDMFYC